MPEVAAVASPSRGTHRNKEIPEVGRGRVGSNPSSSALEPVIHSLSSKLILSQRSLWAIPSQARVQEEGGRLGGQIQ